MMLTRLFMPILTGAALLSASAVAQAGNIEVTITNLTRHQVFSPVLVVSHARRLSLFQAGEPASMELAAIAEGGDTAPMEAMLAETSGVLDFSTSGPIPPGMSASVSILALPNTAISALSMLVNTNDAFLALNGEPATFGIPNTVSVPAYDAGSEANTELCADIPGPACPADSGNAHVDGEGFIHIHNGIHGVGDPELDPAEYDWHNPVASITIKRVR